MTSFLPPDDELVKATMSGMAGGLPQYGLVLSYRVGETGKVSLFCQPHSATEKSMLQHSPPPKLNEQSLCDSRRWPGDAVGIARLFGRPGNSC
jgi:hypothetical protein